MSKSLAAEQSWPFDVVMCQFFLCSIIGWGNTYALILFTVSLGKVRNEHRTETDNSCSEKWLWENKWEMSIEQKLKTCNEKQLLENYNCVWYACTVRITFTSDLKNDWWPELQSCSLCICSQNNLQTWSEWWLVRGVFIYYSMFNALCSFLTILVFMLHCTKFTLRSMMMTWQFFQIKVLPEHGIAHPV